MVHCYQLGLCAPPGFTFSNISRVSIDGLAFIACASASVFRNFNHVTDTTHYGLHLQSVQAAEIIDCTFQDSYGTALGVVDSHVVLRGNRFLNNCRLCSNRRCDYYLGRRPVCYGGGVLLQRSNLNITGSNSLISNSAGFYGGGVSAWDRSNVYINGNTTFIGNSASYGGGVSAWDSSNVYINGNITFIGNSARDGHGRGVSAWNRSNVDVSGNTTFIGNSASDGGGVTAWYISNVDVSGN